MIPRHNPTYSYADLFCALSGGAGEERLSTILRRHFGAEHLFLLPRGRSAIHLLLRAYGRSGEIVIPAYTCHVVPESVHSAGYVPTFADLGKDSVNMTAETVSKAISPRTVGVMITHQFGLPCDVQEILAVCRRHRLLAIEDAAPALGASVQGAPAGSLGDAGIVSFHWTKVITGGTGGALVTNDDDLAKRIRTLVEGLPARTARASWLTFAEALAWKLGTSAAVYHPMLLARQLVLDETKYQTIPPVMRTPEERRGCASYAAALVELQFGRLGCNVERRRHLAGLYARGLSGVESIRLPVVGEGVLPAWIQYPILVPDKWKTYRDMLRESIDLSWTFRYCTADTYGVKNCPNAVRAAQSVLGLPTYPRLSETGARRICSAVRKCVGEPARIGQAVGT